MTFSTENFSVCGGASSSFERRDKGVAEAAARIRFPEGEWSVYCNTSSERERAFGLRYLRDIQFLIDSSRESWSDWESRMEEESCPVLDFDPEWFSFLLPAKEETRMELFAWYWLWAESHRRLTLSRYACQELGGAFDTASRLLESSGELEGFIREVNTRLNAGCVDFRDHLLDPEAEAELKVRLEMGTLWFPGMIVDCEPPEIAPPVGGRRPEFAVWVYLVSGVEDLFHVVGQIRAVRVEGAWKLDPRAIRTYRPAGEVRGFETLSALPE